MRTRGATIPKTNQTAATDALITLVRLLARETARECLNQTSALPETVNGIDRAAAGDARPETIARQRNRSSESNFGEDGAASDLQFRSRVGPGEAKRGKR